MKPGSVRLQASTAAGGGLIVQVKDDGAGVRPEAIPQLFEPFFTTDATGTGLGLYIARELCEANDARLEYVQVPGGGGCFRITMGVMSEY